MENVENIENIENTKKVKKIKEKVKKTKAQKHFDRGQIFVKIMAGILALLMVISVAASLIYSLI